MFLDELLHVRNYKMLYTVILFFCSRILLAQPAQQNLQLLDAVKKNDAPVVKKLLKDGADFRFKDSNGTPLVMWAAYKADAAMVKLLIDAGADYKEKGVIYIDGDKNSFYGHLLGIASGENNLPLVRYLLDDLHVDINEVEYQPDHSASGWTALDWAMYKGYKPIFDYLINKGARIRPETYSIFNQLLQTRTGLEVIAQMQNLNALAKRQNTFTDSLQIYSLILKGRGLIKIKSIKNGLDSIKLARSLAEAKKELFAPLRREALRHIAAGLLSNYEYDSAIYYYRQYFELELSNDTDEQAVVYYEMRNAFRNAGKLSEWEETDQTFQSKFRKNSPGLYTSFLFTYGQLLGQDKAEDEALRAYRGILEVFHEDNKNFARAAVYYSVRSSTELDEVRRIIERVNQFKESFPAYSTDLEFLNLLHALEGHLAMRAAIGGDLNEAMVMFGKALKGNIEPFLNENFEFHSHYTKEIFDIFTLNQGYYRVLAGIESTPNPSTLVSMIANELIRGIVQADRAAKFSTLAKYDINSYSSGLYSELTSRLRKREIVVFMATNDSKMASSFPSTAVYLITPDSKFPKAVAIKNYQSLRAIFFSGKTDVTTMHQVYRLFWEQIQRELPANVKKIYFVGDGVLTNLNIGLLVNPSNSKTVSDAYTVENARMLSDLLKD